MNGLRKHLHDEVVSSPEEVGTVAGEEERASDSSILLSGPSRLPALRWGNRRVVKRSGDVVLLQRKGVDFCVAVERDDEDRMYWYYPTENRTEREAREEATAEFKRRVDSHE